MTKSQIWNRRRFICTGLLMPAAAVLGVSLERLEMTPLRIKNFRLQRAAADEAEWLRATLDREYRRFDAAVERTAAGDLRVQWASQ